MSGFKAGFSKAHCEHCDFDVPLNTAVWRMWLHLVVNHPRVAWSVYRSRE